MEIKADIYYSILNKNRKDSAIFSIQEKAFDLLKIKNLYKYSSYNAKYFKNVQSGTIHLSSPEKFNDISEGKIESIIDKKVFKYYYILEWLYLNKKITKEKYDKLILEIEKFPTPNLLKLELDLIISETKFSFDSDKVYEEILNELNSDNPYLVACFSKSSPLLDDMMWGYYGDSHKGFCIEYNLESICYTLIDTYDSNRAYNDKLLQNNISFIEHLYPVKYTNKTVKINIKKYIKRYIVDKNKLFASESFLKTKKRLQFKALKQKKCCWSQEKEVRLILNPYDTLFELLNQNNGEANINIDKSYINHLHSGKRANKKIVMTEQKFNKTHTEKQNNISYDDINYENNILPF